MLQYLELNKDIAFTVISQHLWVKTLYLDYWLPINNSGSMKKTIYLGVLFGGDLGTVRVNETWMSNVSMDTCSVREGFSKAGPEQDILLSEAKGKMAEIHQAGSCTLHWQWTLQHCPPVWEQGRLRRRGNGVLFSKKMKLLGGSGRAHRGCHCCFPLGRVGFLCQMVELALL